MNGENCVLSDSRDLGEHSAANKAVIAIAAMLTLAGCASLAPANPFVSGGVDSRSPVAGEVSQASLSIGDYPQFKALPPFPTNLRAASAWRGSVEDALSTKRSVEATAAQIPFTLADTEAWAQAERSHIPPGQWAPPAADSQAKTQALAVALQARATPPPPPN